MLEVAFVDRRLARVGYETWVRRGLERAAGRTETVEDLSLVSVKERVVRSIYAPARRTRFRRQGAPWRSRQSPQPFGSGMSPLRLSSCSTQFRTATRLPRLAGGRCTSGQCTEEA